MTHNLDLFVMPLVFVGLPSLVAWGYAMRQTIRFRRRAGRGGESARWHRVQASVLLGFLLFGGILVLSIGPPWFRVAVSPSGIRRAEIAGIAVAGVVYGTAVALASLAFVPLLILAIHGRMPVRARAWIARCLAATIALLAAAGVAEGAAAACLWASSVPMPWLPTRFEDRSADRVVDILVIGESSALGIPYDAWFSVADIVAWKLGEAFPQSAFRVENQAAPGIPLQSMHTKLAGTRRRPELVILYAGHNEFMARFDAQHGAYHYADMTPPATATLQSLARRVSPLLRLMEHNARMLSVSTAPTRTVTRQLVDVPVYTKEQYAERLAEFRARLGVIVSYCERLGARVVLVIPPGNDAGFEPNRSFLPSATTLAEREAFASEFLRARAAETTNPEEAKRAYRRLLERQPGFAETHFRLARLLEQAGEWDAGFQHYVAARDLDGLPMRLPSDFHRIYYDVAARHPRAILVDGPAKLHALGDHGIIGDVFFADGLHPSLNGYTVLAQAILIKLREQRFLGWSANAATPVVTPRNVAKRFHIDGPKWKSICSYSWWFYGVTSCIRHDPTERLAKALRYQRAVQELEAGKPVDSVGVPGVGPRAERAGDRR